MPEKITKLAAVVKVLEDMRANEVIGEYAVGGAVAAAFYAQPISTVGLDIFFVFEPPQTGLILSLEPIYDYVRDRGFEFDKDFIYIGGWPVQFIESSHDQLWSEALKNARKLKVNGNEIAVMPPEHLAAMWIQARREKDIRKIEELDAARAMNASDLHTVLDRFGMMEKWRSIQERLSDDYRF